MSPFLVWKCKLRLLFQFNSPLAREKKVFEDLIKRISKIRNYERKMNYLVNGQSHGKKTLSAKRQVRSRKREHMTDD